MNFWRECLVTNLEIINNQIADCARCPLYLSMPLGPIKAERSKIEDRCVAFIMDAPNSRNSFLSEVLSDDNRWGFFNCVKRWDIPWYLTFVRKCEGHRKVSTYKTCNTWIRQEIQALPEDRLVLTFGENPKKYYGQSDGHFSSWSRTFNNAKSMKKLNEIIESWK